MILCKSAWYLGQRQIFFPSSDIGHLAWLSITFHICSSFSMQTSWNLSNRSCGSMLTICRTLMPWPNLSWISQTRESVSTNFLFAHLFLSCAASDAACLLFENPTTVIHLGFLQRAEKGWIALTKLFIDFRTMVGKFSLAVKQRETAKDICIETFIRLQPFSYRKKMFKLLSPCS